MPLPLCRHHLTVLAAGVASIFFVPARAAADSEGLPSLIAERVVDEGPRAPWPARRRAVPAMRPQHQGVIDLKRWPEEPRSPANVHLRRFSRALRRLCGPRRMPRGRARVYSRIIRRESARFDVDPFALAAVIYDHSRCDPRAKSAFGVGLAAINREMHRPHIKRRRYHYWVRADGVWSPRKLRLRFAFHRGWIRRAGSNIHFAAALLRVARDQCPGIDGTFGSVPHRSPISHLVWGDRVRDAAYEENVLRVRRRLLGYYEGTKPPRCGELDGVALSSPVDGNPVKVLSGWGEDRAGGKRPHKGIDIFSPTGAPVYAVADGVVSFAGVAIKPRRRKGSKRRRRRWRRRNLRPRSVSLSPRRAMWISRRRLALAGRFVMVRHTPSPAQEQQAKPFYSAYMHLDRYVVKKGQKVRAGQLLGLIGNTGIKVSRPHLHFEIRKGLRGHIDPRPPLDRCLIGPEEIFIGRYRRARMGLEQGASDADEDLALIPLSASAAASEVPTTQ